MYNILVLPIQVIVQAKKLAQLKLRAFSRGQQQKPGGWCTFPVHIIRHIPQLVNACPCCSVKMKVSQKSLYGVLLMPRTVFTVTKKVNTFLCYRRQSFLLPSLFYTPFLRFLNFPRVSITRDTTKISQLLHEALCAHCNLFISLFIIQTPLNPGNVINATKQIRKLSTPGSDLTSGDIANIATILENIAAVKEVDGVTNHFNRISKWKCWW